MPTGYTAKIAEGISFEEFAMSCARAFGALITMRDEPADAEIPKFKPSEYHTKALSEKRDLLKRLEGMSEEYAEESASRSYKTRIAEWNKRMKEYADLRVKYEAMLEKVISWEPPSPDHIEMKEFMQDQIKESIVFDCHDGGVRDVAKESGEEWKNAQIQEVERSIIYHEEEMKKEEERVIGRNEWVSQLKNSLEIS